MTITIYDIAKKAKVGVGTVSRALNNHPSVSPDTRERIFKAAKKYNYHPNATAQRLARRKSKTITAIMPFFTNYFFVEMLRGIQDKIREIDYDLVLYGVNHIDQASTYLLRSLRGNHVDGVLFISMDIPEDYIQKYKQFRTPVILVDRYHSELISLTVENVKGAYTAALHLISLGHKRITMINGNPKSLPGKERAKGFMEAMQLHGLAEHASIINATENRVDDGFNKEAGYHAALEIISTSHQKQPTAIFVASDIQAIGTLQAFRENKIRVPDDIAIIGFDDIELAQHFSLSTMRQPIYRMGVLGVELTIQKFEDTQIPPIHKKFEPTLIIRETCGGSKSKPQLDRSQSVGRI